MGVAVALTLAPLTVRGQEVVSVRDGHRPRHALLVIAHVESGRGLLTATALGVEALGRFRWLCRRKRDGTCLGGW